MPLTPSVCLKMFAVFSRNLSKWQKLEMVSSCARRQQQQQQQQTLHTAQQPLLAGHSKWANIKHIKAQKDGERSVIFHRMARQIRLAIQEGGSPDPALNSPLRSVIDEALRKNMPIATIQSTIKKTQQSKSELKKYRLEVRYKQKVFAVCVIYTDKLPQIKIDLATILRKGGATFTDASYIFEDFGLIEAIVDKTILAQIADLEERATEDAIECGAEEVEVLDATTGTVNFICNPVELNGVRRALEIKGYQVEHMEHIYSAKNLVQLTPEELKAYNIFLQKLREVPGLEEIYDNVEFKES